MEWPTIEKRIGGPDGLPIVPRHVELFQGLADDSPSGVIWVDEHNAIAGERYVRGLYQFVPSGREAVDGAVCHVMETLGMHRYYSACSVRVGLVEALRPFFMGASLAEALCFVIYENCREPFSLRCDSFREQGFDIRQEASDWPEPMSLSGKPVDRQSYRSLANTRLLGRSDSRFAVDLNRLPLQLPQYATRRDVQLMRTQHQRVIHGAGRPRPIGEWDSWFLASQFEDRQALLEGWTVPKVSQRLTGNLNPGADDDVGPH